MPPAFMFFSCSRSWKCTVDENTNVSASATKRNRSTAAVSIGSDWPVESAMSNSDVGLVAAANSGSNPPHAMINESTSCEMMCTVFATNIAWSAWLTVSSSVERDAAGVG